MTDRTYDKIELVVGSVCVVNARQVDNLRPVEFLGEEIGKFSALTGDDDTRGIEQTLYRTPDDRLIVHTEDWSKWQGEPTVYSLEEVSEDELDATGRFNDLGRESGYGRPLTLDEALALAE
jgi:hypothetical protein